MAWSRGVSTTVEYSSLFLVQNVPASVNRMYRLYGSKVGCQLLDFGFQIPGLGFQDSSSGFRISDFGERVSGSGSRVSGSELWIWDLGFRVPCLVIRFWCLVFGGLCFGF